MKRTSTIIKVILSGTFLVIIVLMALILLRQFTNVGKSMTVQEKLESFIASENSTIKLSELFPWTWERLCHTGDIASKDVFEDALGRDATIRELLRWYWNGSWVWPMSEGTDNLIFIGPDGMLDIYQYTYFGKAPINFSDKKEKTVRPCVPNSQYAVVAKEIGSKNVVTALNLTETKQ